MYIGRLLWLASLALACAASVLKAAPILVPPSLNAGDAYHLTFVSSAQSNANFGGIAGADALVQSLADAAGIGATQGVTWQALLSDSTTNAVTRFNPGAPIFDTQGNRIAVNGPAFWNAANVPLENAIAFDETGAGGIFPEVWTGTSDVGILARADSNWLGASPATFARSGLALNTGPNWVNDIDTAETVPLSLIAVSSQLTAPGNTVPEPASIAIWTLLVAGLAGFGFYRARCNC